MGLELFRHGLPLKATAWSSLFFFTFTFYSPSALAVKQELDKGGKLYQAAPERPLDELLAETVGELRANTLKAKREVAKAEQELAAKPLLERVQAWFGAQPTVPVKRLAEVKDRLEELKTRVQEDQAAREQHLRDHQLPAEILTRHADQVKAENQRWAELDQALASLDRAESRDTQAEALDRVDALLAPKAKPLLKSFDPKALPFGARKAEVREPAANAEELQRLAPEALPDNSQTSTLDRTLERLGDTLLPQAVADAAPELAETVEVRFTPEIQALAAELGHNPVTIYNWVHDHIEFVPTYGSIQGAAQTLDTRKGNAFDTASLLIALLRASGIPARYAYGTVKIPTAQAMNWVGGVEQPEAALQLLGQGFIPSRGEVWDGVFKYIKMEHVWVEARVDFEPSRGAVNKTADSWVALDASFKQYDYQAGMNLAEAVPFDAQGFANELKNRATVNEAEGWVQNLDQAYVQQQLQSYQAQVEDFIKNTKPDATVGDVLGSQKTIVREARTLDAGLPYSLVGTLWRQADIPDGLRYKFTYQVQDEYGGEYLNVTKNWAELAGKPIAMSFNPASQADEDVLASFMPKPDANGSIDSSQLPSSLPGYLINLAGEFSVDGQVVGTLAAQKLGTELKVERGVYTPGKGWETTENALTVGEYHAIGLDGAAIGKRQLESLKARMEQVKTQLEAKDLTGLTKHDLTGALLQTGVLSYLALNDVQDVLAARSAKMVSFRLPSYGGFSTSLKTTYRWGLTLDRVSFPGVMMDMDRMHHSAWAKDDDRAKFAPYNRALGSRLSAMEHLVPEQLFSTAEQPVSGVSAVKALSLAMAQGQKVYTITSANVSAVLPKLSIDDQALAEIRNALNQGKEVTVSERSISHNGWTGVGYLMIDPESGAGAYKISGGADGGYNALIGASSFIVMLIPLWAGIALIPGIGTAMAVAFVGLMVAGAALLLTAAAMANSGYGDAAEIFCTLGIALILFALMLLFKNPLAGMAGRILEAAVGALLGLPPGKTCGNLNP